MKPLLGGLIVAALIASTANAQSLTTADIDAIVGRGVAEAAAEGAGNGAIAVVDRVGNVLGVYVIDPAHPPMMTVTSGRGIAVGNGLEGLQLPAVYGAIAKAITGAYLSSAGNAFSTRTASQIVEENFDPGEVGAPGGPLFGVQFSQLPCSDITQASASASFGGGPRRSPLGLSADPGGVPLYLNGQVVGGIGAMFDGVYGLDPDFGSYQRNLDELVAIAASQGYTPASTIANTITVDGKILIFADANASSLKSTAASAINPANYVAVAGYTPAGERAGTVFGTAASGVIPDGGVSYPGLDAWVLVDSNGQNRYPPRDAVTPQSGGITASEAQTIVAQGLTLAFQMRGQIRRPLGSFAQVTVSVVDGDGNVLALARTPDQPLFGVDVAVQKARTVLFFSGATADAELRALPAVPLALGAAAPGAPSGIVTVPSPGRYAAAMESFVGLASLEGNVAYGNRSIGNLSRPFYPDGINGNPPGPLSLAFSTWSPFNDGLQLDLVLPDIVARLDGSVAPASGCTALPQGTGANAPRRLADGLQIFPGGVPIYRGNALVGAVGVSGDGIDQDDMVAFLGLYNAGAALKTGLQNAPPAMRADQLKVGGVYLRYVSCPVAPFNNSTAENVCAGK